MSFKSIETTGKTEEEAIEKGLVQLGKTRDEVSVEIVERAKSGFLGLGASPATVRISYEEPDEARSEVQDEKPSGQQVEAQTRDKRADAARDYLTGLFDRMEASVTPVVTETEHGLHIELEGEKLGALIGRRGETLDAIQHLTNYTVNRGFDTRLRINIDAEDYREKREESLVALAERVAAKVVKYKRNFTLEPMNSYERHVIHTALQEYDLVTTYSTGTEPNRRIVVAYDEDHTASSASRSDRQELS